MLALEPDQPQALLFSGVLALRMGQRQRAAALLERAAGAGKSRRAFEIADPLSRILVGYRPRHELPITGVPAG